MSAMIKSFDEVLVSSRRLSSIISSLVKLLLFSEQANSSNRMQNANRVDAAASYLGRILQKSETQIPFLSFVPFSKRTRRRIFFSFSSLFFFVNADRVYNTRVTKEIVSDRQRATMNIVAVSNTRESRRAKKRSSDPNSLILR